MAKYKDFKSALSFLEKYGFEYQQPSKSEKEYYKNKFGKIVKGYKQLDANYLIEEFYIDISGWKQVINLEKEYNNISKKNKKNYDMLYEVINYQLVNNYKIYDLRLELKYIEKLQSIYRYTYFFQKEYLIDKLKKYKGYDDYLIHIGDNNRISIGIERTGHSGGYYYVADIYEENNQTKINGKIVLNPDENGNPIIKEISKKEKIKNTIGIVVITIFFGWLILLIYAIFGIYSLFTKDKRKKIKLTKEQKLDNLMINYLCCEKTEG